MAAIRANSVNRMMILQKVLSPTKLPKSRRESLLRASTSMILSSLVCMSFCATPAAAQAAPGDSRNSQVQTAARARNIRGPSSQWSAGAADDTPSTQPRVTFENGLLSISANNSSLSDILVAVHSCTGADIDLPGSVSSERVTVQLGPGPARKVLSDLLGWSSYDYIIQGSPTDSLSVQSVTLMLRTKSVPAPATPTPEMANRRPYGLPPRPAPEAIAAPAPTEVTDVQSAADQPADRKSVV